MSATLDHLFQRRTDPMTWGPASLRADRDRGTANPMSGVAGVVRLYDDTPDVRDAGPDGLLSQLRDEMGDNAPQIMARQQGINERLVDILEDQMKGDRVQRAKDAEADRKVKLRELDIREKEAANQRRMQYMALAALIVLAGGRAVFSIFPVAPSLIGPNTTATDIP